jgi:hypothetical protein
MGGKLDKKNKVKRHDCNIAQWNLLSQKEKK